MGKEHSVEHDKLIVAALDEWIKVLTTTTDLALIRSKREAYEKISGTTTEIEVSEFTKWGELGSTVQGSD